MYEDDDGAISWSKNSPTTARSKDINVRHHYPSRQELERGFLFFPSHFHPLPFLGTSPWSQGIIKPCLPLSTPCILVSWIVSALPHRVKLSSSRLSQILLVHSRPHAFNGDCQILLTKDPNAFGGNRTIVIPTLMVVSRMH